MDVGCKTKISAQIPGLQPGDTQTDLQGIIPRLHRLWRSSATAWKAETPGAIPMQLGVPTIQRGPVVPDRYFSLLSRTAAKVALQLGKLHNLLESCITSWQLLYQYSQIRGSTPRQQAFRQAVGGWLA